jgi:hypothetical protein
MFSTLMVEKVASHMSAEQLDFRLAYGESPYAYVMMRRIERAWRRVWRNM